MATQPKRHLLLVDDSRDDYLRSLSSLLLLEGYDVTEADSVESAMAQLAAGTFDVVIADIRLRDPNDDYDFSGLSVARAAADRDIPCIAITSYETAENVRVALRTFRDRPLAVEVKFKREGPQPVLDALRFVAEQAAIRETPPDPTGSEAPSGGLVIDLDRQRAWLNGAPLSLSRMQYNLLAHLYRNAGTVCTHQDLYRVVYEETMSAGEAIKDGRLERIVSRLREKIEDDPADPHRLITERGRGFRLAP